MASHRRAGGWVGPSESWSIKCTQRRSVWRILGRVSPSLYITSRAFRTGGGVYGGGGSRIERYVTRNGLSSVTATATDDESQSWDGA